MKFINLASGKSAWRGYEYYTENRVNYHISCGNSEYRGKVSGNGKTYDVHINIEHPRSSSCNCPHTEGKRNCMQTYGCLILFDISKCCQGIHIIG